MVLITLTQNMKNAEKWFYFLPFPSSIQKREAHELLMAEVQRCD